MDTNDRFKPEIGQRYYVWGDIQIDGDGQIRISEETCEQQSDGWEINEDYYNSGNCWETEQQAEAYGKAIKELAMRMHEGAEG